MKARFLAAAAACLCALYALSAQAADVAKQSQIAAPVQVADPGWNRQGPYAVALGAYDVFLLQEEGLDLSSGKLMGGAALGYNFRSGSFMWGVEADWMFTGIKASTTSGQGEDSFQVSASTSHLASVRLRAGMPMGPALLYMTAGPAWQHSKLTVDGDSKSDWLFGLAAGAGAEVEVTKTIFARIEVLHYAFPDNGVINSLWDSTNQHTTARVGIGFKLN